MSKELIEQLAKEHGFTAHDPKKHGIMSWGSVNTESLEAFAKAYAQTQGQSIPADPTKEMIEAFFEKLDELGYSPSKIDLTVDECKECYKAMLTSAPIESGVKG